MKRRVVVFTLLIALLLPGCSAEIRVNTSPTQPTPEPATDTKSEIPPAVKSFNSEDYQVDIPQQGIISSIEQAIERGDFGQPTTTPDHAPSPTPEPEMDYSDHLDWPESYEELEWMLEQAYESGWEDCMDEYGIEP